MPQIIDLQTFSDDRGDLTVIEKVLPFEIKRVYYLYNSSATATRAEHKHKVTHQALICVNGSCEIHVWKKGVMNTILMDNPTKCMILEPEDWHSIDKFSDDAVLLVLASEYFDPKDYVNEK